MSTAVLTDAADAPAARQAPAGPTMGRLTLVELRKMTDTRAGRWLLAITLLIGLALVVVRIFAGGSDGRTAEEFYSFAMLGTSILLPVLGILAVTSEWNQRTALTTFTLVPRRSRVIGAKVLAALAVAVAATVAALVYAVGANLVTDLLGRGGDWDLGIDAIAYGLLYQVLNMMMGLAFGALLINSALAIVLYFVIPLAWSIIGQAVSGLHTVANWLDLGITTDPLLTNAMSGDDWGKLATSTAFWILAPLVGGLIRVTRQDVK